MKHTFLKTAALAGATLLAYDAYKRKKDNLQYPYILDEEMKKTLASLKRIDEEGYLYHMDYTADYHKAIIKKLFTTFAKVTSGGCSAFMSKNEYQQIITARNYDLPHMNKDGKITGLNVAIHCSPKGKYRSLNFCDAMWLYKMNKDFTSGCLDNKKTDLTLLLLLPYLTMDGINEKGLTCSILALDIKNNEKAVKQNEPHKLKKNITVLVRELLDNCANINECIHYAQNINLINTMGSDFHLFLTDRTNRSVVFEWRHNEFKVIESDACTNFYQCEDDGEDCYYGSDLKEKFVANKETIKQYHFGYGHGYERFNQIIAYLNNKESITNDEAGQLLSQVSQKFDGSLTSNTQYSVVYNNETLKAEVYSYRNYSKKYFFEV